MGTFSDGDPQYLRREQYADGANLTDRQTLHDRFSTNPVGWHRWVFEQLDLGDQPAVLEVACGTGALWTKNADRLHGDLDLVLTDFSSGMVEQAVSALGPGVRGQVADVQRLPFAEDDFDVVICNHALYHVPDRPRAVAELRRVLRPSGRAYVATNGRSHLRELDHLRQRHLPDWEGDDTADVFGLETGRSQLAAGFSSIDIRRYRDQLRVTEVAPLVDYVVSSVARHDDDSEGLATLAAEVTAAIEVDGAFTITKDSGLFVCS